MKTVLTNEQIDQIAISSHIMHESRDHDIQFARAIEQAVLHSEQVQAWKRDAERINAMEQKRILVMPEYEGGWHAEIYDDQETPIATGYGDCPRAAIDAVMEKQT